MVFLVSQIWPGLVAAFILGACLGLVLRRALGAVALKTDLPDFSVYVTRAALEAVAAAPRQLPESAPALPPRPPPGALPDVMEFLSEDALALFAQKSDLPDLTPYARRSELDELRARADGGQWRAEIEKRDREIAMLWERVERDRLERVSALTALEARLTLPAPRRRRPAQSPGLRSV
jgi:hypothetical protein